MAADEQKFDDIPNHSTRIDPIIPLNAKGQLMVPVGVRLANGSSQIILPENSGVLNLLSKLM